MREKKAYSIAKPYNVAGVWGVQFLLPEQKTDKKMKKTLLTVAMCAASLVGTAFAENPFKVEETAFDYVVTGEGTLTECLAALNEKGITFENIVRFGVKDGERATVKITSDNSVTPSAGVLEFANATLVFEDLVTLLPNYDEAPFGPGMMAGWLDGGWSGNVLPGDLTIQVAKSAVDDWLSKQEHLDVMASFSLLDDAAEIQPTAGANVNFQLVDDQGQVIVSKGDLYVLDEQHKYTNSGIVWSAGDLLKNQIALHFVPGGEEDWGGGQFNVLALGENYVPVPEPATGTLSLLALAGLAARRRRK